MVFMMSGYVSQGAWCTSVYPDGDMKYATDYFFWKFANDPQLEGIYGLGYYDFRHSDEELVRWTAALFRHYCIDGNKTMLSEKYGFTCTPGHIKNGDFNEGMDHWQPVPAEEGSLTHWNLKGFGGNAWQLRQREEGSHGDYAAQFIRSAKAPNKLTQVARGLTPGKKYALLFVTADADDAVNRLCHRREFQFNVSLKGATVLPEFSNEYRLPRTIPENPQNRRCEFVNHKVVFTADKPEVTVTFSDWQDDSTPGAPIGQKRVVNYISLVPFFDEGM
jgi:hypothetical protein